MAAVNRTQSDAISNPVAISAISVSDNGHAPDPGSHPTLRSPEAAGPPEAIKLIL